MVLNRPDENRGSSGGVEERLGQECRGGFAVGAGDASGGKRALGMAEECGRSLGKRAAAVLDMKDGQAGLIDREMVEGLRGVGDDAERAGGEAFSTKRLPSVDPPFMATKTAPGRTRRESYSMPVMGAAELPAKPAEVISAMSSFQIISGLIVDGAGAAERTVEKGRGNAYGNVSTNLLDTSHQEPAGRHRSPQFSRPLQAAWQSALHGFVLRISASNCELK
jgi:hypothetical protein